MAISFANLGASVGQASNTATNPDINTTTDATSFSNSSWTPPTDGLIIAFVYSRRNVIPPDTPSVSGNSLTWVQIGTTLNVGNGKGSISLFAADASGSATGVTTFDFGVNTQNNCIVSLFHVTGVDLSGGVAAVFVQSPTNTGTGTSGTVSLSAAGAVDNRPISCFANAIQSFSEERANWTELDDMKGSTISCNVITQYRDDTFETTASASWPQSTNWGGIAAELKAEVVGPAAGFMTLNRGYWG